MTRAGSMIAQQWRQFGIDATTDGRAGHAWSTAAPPAISTPSSRWSVETWGGHPDLSFFLDSWHSQFVAPPGKPQPPRNWQRWTNPELDKIIEQIRTDRLRRSQGPRARPRLREARGARDADHPADVLQRLHGDGRRPTGPATRRRDRALHRSGAELGQLALHDGQAEARASNGNRAAERGAAGSPPPLPSVSRLQSRLARDERLRDLRVEAASASSRSSSSSASTSPSSSRTRRRSIRSSRSIAAATAVRQHQPRGDRDDAPVAARALRPRGRPVRAVRRRSGGASLSAISGPSLSAFPTPVSVLIGARAAVDGRRCWSSRPLLTWVLGNLLGGLAGYYRDNRALQARRHRWRWRFHPIPYYIVAFVLLIVFGYLWPVLPISGGYADEHGARLELRRSSAACCSTRILPVCSLVLVGLGGWFMGMRSLVSNIVTEDYVTYAELGGVEPRPHPRLLRHAQRAGAAGHRARHVARRDLQRRHHHRAGVRLSGHRHAAGVGRACRRLQPGARHHHVSIVGGVGRRCC